MGLPLPVPLLLKYDISEAAGAPKEGGRNGSQWGARAEGTDRRTGEGDGGQGK